MSTTYPTTITDGTGRTWEWSDAWNGYRAEGMTTHGYETIRTQWGIQEQPATARHDCAEGSHWPCTAVSAARQRREYDPEMAERAAIQADAENERDGYRD